MKRYDKLVRDRIVDLIREKGEQAESHIASDKEYHSKLREKLTEELHELLQSESADEIADLLEVLDAFAHFKGYTEEEIMRIKEDKRRVRGGFVKRIILDRA